MCSFGAKWIKCVLSMRLALRECCRLCWALQRDRDRWDINHFSARGHTVRYLPCSSGNSPTSSDNLDQSVGSMNPHLPGAQGKISRPSQVVRDWRHEITFSVFDSLYCLSKHNAEAGETHKKRSGGVLLGALFPHIRSRPNFGTNSGDAQSSSEPRTRMRNTHSLTQNAE